jgi:carboxymethylenebutenolidase
MASTIALKSTDGQSLGGYLATPADGRRFGGVVVIQEIFGVNKHIRAVADGFASKGYVALAPAMFDRVEKGIEIGYEQADIQRGVAIMGTIPIDTALGDITAAVKHLTAQDLSVAVVGYCWGGSLAWAASAKVDGLACAVAYYGGKVLELADLVPKCPTLLHFGEKDTGIPIDKVRAFMAKRPELPVHIYPAGHGFNCDHRASYDAACAAQALERTLAFFDQHLGK